MDVDVVNFGMRLAVGTLFLASGAAKLRVGPSRVMQSVGAYKIVSARWAVRIGRVLCPAEILVGGALLAGLTTTIASLSGIGLLSIFNVAIGAALLKGRRNDCGCGIGGGPISRRLLVRNSGLIALLIVCAVQASSRSN